MDQVASQHRHGGGAEDQESDDEEGEHGGAIYDLRFGIYDWEKPGSGSRCEPARQIINRTSRIINLLSVAVGARAEAGAEAAAEEHEGHNDDRHRDGPANDEEGARPAGREGP